VTPRQQKKTAEPTGLPRVDRLADLPKPSLDDYLAAVSEYVREQNKLDTGPKKAAQLRLSLALGKALLAALQERLPAIKGEAGERNVSGALRVVKADVSEFHQLDGLRLAIEIKPVNLAVGRAIWNRFGDIRTFAVNLHLKFPFAVVGGVLVVPTYEEKEKAPKPTTHLIQRAVGRLVRAGGRRTEGDAPHLLENLCMARHGARSAIRWVPVDRVTTAFPKELAPVAREVPKKLVALHSTGMASGSRRTSWPSASRRANSRLALTMS
jgi:hypothetical protein